MQSRIEAQLLDVLTIEEKKRFNLEGTLKKINETLKDIK